jgi:hypothetical protein
MIQTQLNLIKTPHNATGKTDHQYCQLRGDIEPHHRRNRIAVGEGENYNYIHKYMDRQMTTLLLIKRPHYY